MSFLSLAFCALALFCLSSIALSLYQYESLSSLKIAITAAQEQTARLHFTRLSNPPSFIAWSRISFAISTVNPGDFESIFALLPSLNREDCSSALRIGEVIDHEKLGTSEIREQLIACSLASQTLDQAQLDLRQVQKYLRNYPHDYEELAKKFGALLTLQPARNSADQVELAPYSDGVLKGLPRLEGLRDGLTTLADLKLELTALNAKVQISAPNPFEVFKSRIDELLSETNALSSERKKAIERVEQIKTESAKLEARKKQLISSILSGLAQIFEVKARELIDPNTSWLKKALDNIALTI